MHQFVSAQVHVESADIIRWLDAAFEGPALAPADPAARRDMEGLLKGPCSEVVSAGLDLMAGDAGRSRWLDRMAGEAGRIQQHAGRTRCMSGQHREEQQGTGAEVPASAGAAAAAVSSNVPSTGWQRGGRLHA